MKAIILSHLVIYLILHSASLGSVLGQGIVYFANLADWGRVDAPVTYSNGARIGPEFIAQLYGGPEGTPVSEMKPLFPTGTFWSDPRFYGYMISGYSVTVPGVDPGQYGTFVMRVYDGATWETSSCRGESLPVTVLLQGGSVPPDPLYGLQSFSVNCIPEPSAAALLALAGIMLGIFRNSCGRRSFPLQKRSGV